MVEQIQHHFHQGELLYLKQDFAAAIQSFEQCTRLMPIWWKHGKTSQSVSLALAKIERPLRGYSFQKAPPFILVSRQSGQSYRRGTRADYFINCTALSLMRRLSPLEMP